MSKTLHFEEEVLQSKNTSRVHETMMYEEIA